MSNSILPCLPKEVDESSSDDLNNNSFLPSKSDNLVCDSMKENLGDKEMNQDVFDTKIQSPVSHDDDLEVGSTKTDSAYSSGQYSCHLCSFVCVKKNEFQEHLLTHYTYSCDQCDYASRTEGRLKRHVKDFHSSSSPENFSGQKVPSNNPKSLKCKHCGITSSTKEKHWSHQRTHLDIGKCLQCPKCPFITEYKHHLEYHVRNHEKIKPYKCPKCQYRCVNKSMLNSHKKSHSNVYQFRCADCPYASKYCHSLKQHLSRQSHQPAPVLNEDGSLPSYDNSGEILSMKRGPNNRSNLLLGGHDTLTLLPPATAPSHHNQDHIDSLLRWTLGQCYSVPLTTLPPLPPASSASPCQSVALDLSVRPPIQDHQLPTLRFHTQPPLDGSLLCQEPTSHFTCTKCAHLFNNVIDFFAHLPHMCS